MSTLDPSRTGSGGDTSDAGAGLGSNNNQSQTGVGTGPSGSGHWIDAGNGTWAWVPGSDGMGSTTSPPDHPPPSATGSSAGINTSQATGTDALRQDIAARQAAPNPYAGQIDTASVSKGGPAVTTSPAQQLASAAPGIRGPINPSTFNTGAGIGTGLASKVTPQIPGGYDLGSYTTPGAPSKTQAAADAAKQAIGPAPQINMGLADRQLGPYNEALSMSREVLDRLLNSPDISAQIGAQSLASQLALARSARGGPGAVQSALDNAQQQAPQLQQQASIQASQEQQARLSTAGQVAGGFANAALGARGQDIGIAQDNQSAGLAVLQNVTQLTGTQLNIDQQQQNLIGEMARDASAMNYNYAALDQKTQEAEFDRAVQLYGIDTTAAAQIKAAGIAVHKGPMDYLMGLVGAGATVAAGFAAKP